MADIPRYPEFSRVCGPKVPWVDYSRKVPQRALRIEGPFYVHTGDNSGKTFCEDGYLLIRESRLFPMAKGEFEATFVEESPIASRNEDGQ